MLTAVLLLVAATSLGATPGARVQLLPARGFIETDVRDAEVVQAVGALLVDETKRRDLTLLRAVKSRPLQRKALACTDVACTAGVLRGLQADYGVYVEKVEGGARLVLVQVAGDDGAPRVVDALVTAGTLPLSLVALQPPLSDLLDAIRTVEDTALDRVVKKARAARDQGKTAAALLTYDEAIALSDGSDRAGALWLERQRALERGLPTAGKPGDANDLVRVTTLRSAWAQLRVAVGSQSAWAAAHPGAAADVQSALCDFLQNDVARQVNDASAAVDRAMVRDDVDAASAAVDVFLDECPAHVQDAEVPRLDAILADAWLRLGARDKALLRAVRAYDNSKDPEVKAHAAQTRQSALAPPSTTTTPAMP